jgi:hypothetical protein
MPTDTRMTNTEILRRGYEAFNRGDMSEVFRMFAPDVEWTTPEGMNDFGIGGVHKGHEEVATFFGRLPGVFGDLRVEPQRFVEQGDHVVVLGTHHVRTPSGVAADYRFAHAWTMSGGLATRFEEFVDTAVVHRLLANGRADD